MNIVARLETFVYAMTPFIALKITFLSSVTVSTNFVIRKRDEQKQEAQLSQSARRFASLNISLSNSRSLKVIRNLTLEYSMCKSPVSVLLKLCLYLVPFLR